MNSPRGISGESDRIPAAGISLEKSGGLRDGMRRSEEPQIFLAWEDEQNFDFDLISGLPDSDETRDGTRVVGFAAQENVERAEDQLEFLHLDATRLAKAAGDFLEVRPFLNRAGALFAVINQEEKFHW